MPPALRRWGARLGLAIVVATTIGYVPGRVLRRDPRTVKLHAQLGELAEEASALQTTNTRLYRSIRALETDVGAIEDRARADLGMVYPDEIVLRVPGPAAESPGPAPASDTPATPVQRKARP